MDKSMSIQENHSKKFLLKRDIIFIIFLLGLGVILFKGCFAQGMQFDEVYRVNNVYSVFDKNAQPFNQSIFSIRSIPIMYKEYISSACIIPYLPLLLFNDPLIALRVLNFIYYIIPIIPLYFVLKKYDYKLAVVSAILIAISPILFPEIRIKFATTWQLLPIAYLLLCIKRNVINYKVLFLNCLFLGLMANITFYFVWDITAIFVVSVIFYRGFWQAIFKNIKNILCMLAGFMLGLINFVIYNIVEGFPTVKKLIFSIFFKSTYNKNPIDYKPATTFIEAINIKKSNFERIMGPYSFLFFILLLLMIGLLVFTTVKCYKNFDKQFFQRNKLYYMPAILLILVGVFIALSPNATGSHHFSFLVFHLVMTFTCSTFLIFKLQKNSICKIISCIIIIIFGGFSLISTCIDIADINKSGGEGDFSPAIFELNDFLLEYKIEGDDMLFINWGQHSQLYFLRRGNFKISEIVFKLMKKDKETAFKNLEEYFMKETRRSLYIPIKNGFENTVESSTETKMFFEFVSQYGGKLEKVKSFYERNGQPVLVLYQLTDINVIKDNLISSKQQVLDEYDGQKLFKLQDKITDYANGCYEVSSEGTFWVKSDFQISIKNKHKDLLIKGYLPDFSGFLNRPINIDYYVNNTIIGTKTVDVNSEFSIRIPYKDIEFASESENIVLKLISDSVIVPKEKGINEDQRELSYVLQYIGYDSEADKQSVA